MSDLSESLRLFITNAGSQSDLEVAGEIDLGTVGELRDHLDLLVTSGTGDVTVNTEAVTFCDATALHVLVDAYGILQRSDRHIHVVHPSRSMMRVLQLTELDAVFVADPSHGGTTADNPLARPCRSLGRRRSADPTEPEGGAGAHR